MATIESSTNGDHTHKPFWISALGQESQRSVLLGLTFSLSLRSLLIRETLGCQNIFLSRLCSFRDQQQPLRFCDQGWMYENGVRGAGDLSRKDNATTSITEHIVSVYREGKSND
jgi:hypothetical protein